MGFISVTGKTGIRYSVSMTEERKKQLIEFMAKHPELTLMEAIHQMPSKDEEVEQSPSEIQE